MTTKILAVLGVLVGGLGVILTALVAFGVNVSPDQHTAIIGLGSLLLAIVSAYLHPNIPVGNRP